MDLSPLRDALQTRYGDPRIYQLYTTPKLNAMSAKPISTKHNCEALICQLPKEIQHLVAAELDDESLMRLGMTSQEVSSAWHIFDVDTWIPNRIRAEPHKGDVLHAITCSEAPRTAEQMAASAVRLRLALELMTVEGDENCALCMLAYDCSSIRYPRVAGRVVCDDCRARDFALFEDIWARVPDGDIKSYFRAADMVSLCPGYYVAQNDACETSSLAKLVHIPSAWAIMRKIALIWRSIPASRPAFFKCIFKDNVVEYVRREQDEVRRLESIVRHWATEGSGRLFTVRGLLEYLDINGPYWEHLETDEEYQYLWQSSLDALPPHNRSQSTDKSLPLQWIEGFFGARGNPKLVAEFELDAFAYTEPYIDEPVWEGSSPQGGTTESAEDEGGQ